MSIEERLVRDVAAVIGGVVVTESDLREARARVDHRVEAEHRRPRRSTLLGAAAAVALAAVAVAGVLTSSGSDPKDASVLAGPGEGVTDVDADHLIGAAPTPGLVEGIWRVDNSTVSMMFGRDGTVRFDDRGALLSQPAVTGTYVIDGDRIIVTTTASERQECVGTSFATRASVPSAGLMHIVRTDAASPCSPLLGGRQVLEQVLPAGPNFADLRFSTDGGWSPLTSPSFLHGVWSSEGGGHVLEMNDGGSYDGGGYSILVGSGELADTGTWALRGSDLTLTSAAGSPRCRAGDQLVLSSVTGIAPGTRAFRGVTKQDACRGGWEPAAWVLVPDEST